ncbi:hypothetical protein UFOVP635_22 [uncultured Caudovirales phage]|uniref:Uncharacterized protein n=1 Tax=uncultured Caudovirales phage TaxID=2100421 RepID=A0A6J5N4K0_9CAUD|nr:hypothetical protein UFOVP635_22 [uncultured Caudovirales phage]
MTTAFQHLFDNAETLSINRRRNVTQTQSRDGTVKSTSLGGQLWQFEVKMPDGPRWSDLRPVIEKMEALDRVTVGTVQLNHANFTWLSGYQGSMTNIANVIVSYSAGNTLTITSGGSTPGVGQYKFRAGDFIQLGTGSVYSVAADVAYNSNTITVNRPVREAAGSYTLKVGPAVSWNVICTSFPSWTIFARNQVSWNGPFVFVEAV